MPSPAPVDRGQTRNFSVVLLAFLGGIVAAALFFMFLNQAWMPLMDIAADNSSLAAASTGISYARRGWTHYLFFALILLASGGLAGAAAIKGLI